MSDNKTAEGLGFTTGLQLLFIALKLCKVIAWSWWWILSPTWIPFGILLFILLVVFISWIAGQVQEKKEAKKLRSKWEQRLDQMNKQKEIQKQKF